MGRTTPQGAADGEDTLIARRWVLTAAHVAVAVKPRHRVTVGAGQYLVGVSSGQSSRATGGLPGRYGVTEFNTRVSRIRELD